MIRTRSLVLLFLGLLIASAPAYAQGTPVLSVNVDRGIPVTLNAPAASVFIANPDVADIQVMSPTSVMVFGKKTGQTTLLATDSSGRALLQRTVVVSQDLSDLRRELTVAIPGNKIAVEALPDGIVLTGETRDALAVEDARKIAARYIGKDGAIINRIQVVGSNQIMLRVRFAEVSRTVDKQFGINWGNLTSMGGFVFGLASGAPLSAISSIGSLSGTAGTPPGSATLTGQTTNAQTATDGLTFSHQGGRVNVNGLLDALAQDGLVTTLAEPNLTAMSGETANFLAGGQVPIVTPQPNGSVSIQYVSYGISLEFTPTLVGESRINLHVKPEVSEPSSIGEVTLSTGTVTAFITRKAETTVELASGQSFAIAGLLDNSQNQAINKFPFLGDIPILGPLFRSTDFQNNQSELVIVVTPYVVKPGSNAQAMALPMDGYSPPSDSERLLGLRDSSGDPNVRPMSNRPLAVPASPLGVMPNASLANPAPTAALPTDTTSNMTLNQPTTEPVEQDAASDNTADNNGDDEAPTPAPAPAPVAAVTPAAPALEMPAAAPVAPPVAPVSANAVPIIKDSSSSSSPSGFILE